MPLSSKSATIVRSAILGRTHLVCMNNVFCSMSLVITFLVRASRAETRAPRHRVGLMEQTDQEATNTERGTVRLRTTVRRPYVTRWTNMHYVEVGPGKYKLTGGVKEKWRVCSQTGGFYPKNHEGVIDPQTGAWYHNHTALCASRSSEEAHRIEHMLFLSYIERRYKRDAQQDARARQFEPGTEAYHQSVASYLRRIKQSPRDPQYKRAEREYYDGANGRGPYVQVLRGCQSPPERDNTVTQFRGDVDDILDIE